MSDFILTGIRYPNLRIQAIKELRAVTGMGLRDSKDAVDQAMGFFEPASPIRLTAREDASLTGLEHLLVTPLDGADLRAACVEFVLFLAATRCEVFATPEAQAFLTAVRA